LRLGALDRRDKVTRPSRRERDRQFKYKPIPMNNLRPTRQQNRRLVRSMQFLPSNFAPSHQKGKRMDLIRIAFSILLPPVGVLLQVGLGVQFWVNIVLTLLGYFPGLIHAVYIIGSR
jgi:uncharacterized membrane protein YqaE (UPF0057 family)